jgi:two-component sensor histidine kinase
LASSERSAMATVTLAAAPVVCGLIATLLFMSAATNQALVTHTLQVKEKLGVLLSATQDIEMGRRRFLITANDAFLPAYERGLATVFDTHRNVLQLVKDNPEQTTRVAALKSLIDESIAGVEGDIISIKATAPTDAAKLAMLERGATIAEKLRLEIAVASAEESRLFELRKAALEQRRTWLIATLCLSILSGLAIAYYIWHREQERSRLVDAANLVLEEARVLLSEKVEERTADLAKERDRAETLLRDVTHRIGNTLTLVVGFLNLHIRHSPDPETIKTLTGARERVMAISSAQRRMNVANDLELVRIDMLIKGVLDDLAEAQPNDKVTFVVDIPALHAPAREATSLCVLIQEFVVNALKHAFPDGRSGEITIRLRPLAERGASLQVSDNGIGGVPEAANPGLGTQISERLARQFGGEVSYKSTNGGLSVEVEMPDLSLTSLDSVEANMPVYARQSAK